MAKQPKPKQMAFKKQPPTIGNKLVTNLVKLAQVLAGKKE